MKNRNLIFVTLASIFTLGIYDIYWMFSTRNELVKKKYDVPSPLLIVVPILVFFVLVIINTAFARYSPYGGSEITTVNIFSLVVVLVSFIAMIPLAIYWVWRYSQAVEKVTKKALKTEISLIIAIVANVASVGFLWPIIVQYYFNNSTPASTKKSS